MIRIWLEKADFSKLACLFVAVALVTAQPSQAAELLGPDAALEALKRGDKESAREIVRQAALAADRSNDAVPNLIEVGRIFRKFGFQTAAIVIHQRAVDRFNAMDHAPLKLDQWQEDDLPKAHLSLALSLLAAGRPSDAEKALHQISTRLPKEPIQNRPWKTDGNRNLAHFAADSQLYYALTYQKLLEATDQSPLMVARLTRDLRNQIMAAGWLASDEAQNLEIIVSATLLHHYVEKHDGETIARSLVAFGSEVEDLKSARLARMLALVAPRVEASLPGPARWIATRMAEYGEIPTVLTGYHILARHKAVKEEGKSDDYRQAAQLLESFLTLSAPLDPQIEWPPL